ncbi:MAG: hypothetical protein P8Z81_08295 [Deinococcales bacterium]
MIEKAPPAAIDLETFTRQAEALAAMHELTPCRSRPRRYRHRIDVVRERVRSLYARLPSDEPMLPDGGRWLLDNDYLVLRTLRQADEDVSAAFYRVLPCVAEGGANPLRIEVLIDGFLDRCRGRAQIGALEAFVEAYQRVAPLMLAELWALPALLRVHVLERLVDAADREVPATRGSTGEEGTIAGIVQGLRTGRSSSSRSASSNAACEASQPASMPPWIWRLGMPTGGSSKPSLDVAGAPKRTSRRRPCAS